MYSGGLAVTFESLQLKNCTFQGFVRGFIRVQGPRYKVFKKMIFEDCLFYNQGYYDNNGRGYSWIAGDGGHDKTNLYNDFQMRRCTFYDSPRHALISDNNKDRNWGDDVKFNIAIENCTFINFSTRSKSRMLFDLRYMPNDSKITFKNNLIVLAKDKNDKRDLNQAAADFRNINGAGLVTFDIQDNYSLGCVDGHMKDDGIFNAAAFSASKNSVGDKWDWTPVLFQVTPTTSRSRLVLLRFALMNSSQLRILPTQPSTRVNPTPATMPLPIISSRPSRFATMPRLHLTKSIRSASATPAGTNQPFTTGRVSAETLSIR